MIAERWLNQRAKTHKSSIMSSWRLIIRSFQETKHHSAGVEEEWTEVCLSGSAAEEKNVHKLIKKCT